MTNRTDAPNVTISVEGAALIVEVERGESVYVAELDSGDLVDVARWVDGECVERDAQLALTLEEKDAIDTWVRLRREDWR